MLRVKSPQDFGAGVVFVLLGLAGYYFGSDLAFGTAARMGPGYFPMLLSGLIVVVGAVGHGARKVPEKWGRSIDAGFRWVQAVSRAHHCLARRAGRSTESGASAIPATSRRDRPSPCSSGR